MGGDVLLMPKAGLIVKVWPWVVDANYYTSVRRWHARSHTPFIFVV